MNAPVRTRLAPLRAGYTRTVELGGELFTFTASLDSAGRIREVFASAAQSGDVVRGLLDGWCILLSLGLQHGLELAALMAKFRHGRFEPSGMTGDSDIRNASSVLDWAAQWLLDLEARGDAGTLKEPSRSAGATSEGRGSALSDASK